MNNCWGGTVRISQYVCCNKQMTSFKEEDSKKFYCLTRVYKCLTCQKTHEYMESAYSKGSWIKL